LVVHRTKSTTILFTYFYTD